MDFKIIPNLYSRLLRLKIKRSKRLEVFKVLQRMVKIQRLSYFIN